MKKKSHVKENGEWWQMLLWGSQKAFELRYFTRCHVKILEE